MPSGIKAQVTPLQIARNGHIAAALREFMRRNSIEKISDLAVAVGMRRTDTKIYGYLSGKVAPGPAHAKAIHKKTGIPMADLQAREPPPLLESVTAPQLLLTGPPAAARTPAAAVRVPEVMGMSMAANGETTIRLNVTLPYAKAMPFVRMLMDAGIVFSVNDDASDNDEDKDTDT